MPSKKQLLLTDNYYGVNDYQPLTGCKKWAVYLVALVFSPVILVLIIIAGMFLYIKFTCFNKLSGNQVRSGKVIPFDQWFKAPGKKLIVKHCTLGTDTTDLIIPADGFVDANGYFHPCGGINGVCGVGFSLRKSVEQTINSLVNEGPYGAKIKADTDVLKQHYMLNGSTFHYDPSYDEFWGSSAKFGLVLGSIYSWAPNGMSDGFHQATDVDTLPDVLGYVYLLEVTNKAFYDTDRIEKIVGNVVNCPKITPDNEGKLFVRFGFSSSYAMGNLKKSEPDAYIFKGKAHDEAGLKLLHTYRILKPEAEEESETEDESEDQSESE